MAHSESWDTTYEGEPASSDSPATGDDEFRDLKRNVRERLELEHYWKTSTNDDGKHLAGSGKAYVTNTEPTNAPSGESLDATDTGQMWFLDSTGEFFIYTGANFVPITKFDTNVEITGTLDVGTLTGATTITTNLTVTGTLATSNTLAIGSHTGLSFSTNTDLGSGTNTNIVSEYAIEQYVSNSGGFSVEAAIQAEDIIWSTGTITQRTIYTGDLTVSGDVTLKANKVVVDGTLTIDTGATLTIDTLYPIGTEDNLLSNGGTWYGQLNYMGAPTSSPTIGGKGTLGGANGANSSEGGAGGGSISEQGGTGSSATAGAGGTELDGIGTFGGRGADGTLGSAGGGAGPGAAGGGGQLGQNNGGAGGGFCCFIVRNNFVNNGTIAANGANGEGGDTYGGGGGGGGMLMFYVLGDNCTVGTIEAEGGNGGISTRNGGVGGGGHVSFYGHTSDFTGLSVIKGASGNTTNGANGTTHTVDLDSLPTELLGGDSGDVYSGLFERHFIEGALF